MYSKELTRDDLDDIKSCIYHHTTIYGVPIDHEKLLKKIMFIMDEGKVYGCYENGECIGIATQFFWKTMPVWTFSNLYVKNSRTTLRMTDYYAEVILSLMEEGAKYAESKECFEFYYVVRDNLKTARKKSNRQVIDNTNSGLLADKYEFENLHFLKSVDDIKWDYLRVIVGDVGMMALASRNNRMLVVRRARLSRAARETS